MRKRNTFRPTDIGGCTLWLDGADVTTTSMTYSSGSNLSVWKDKSGSANNFSLTSGTPASITDGGYRVVSIPSGAIMTSANQITFTTSSAFFIVSKLLTINPISANINMLLGFTNINPYGTSGDFSIRFYQGVLQGSSTSGNPGNLGDLGNGKYYVNGSFNPNFDTTYYMNSYSIIDTVAPIQAGTSYLTISSSLFSRPFIGNVAELIYYSGGVTDPQRQQVEAYLSQKWGLRQQIPQSHPGTTAIVYSQQSIPKAIYLPYQVIFTPLLIQPGTCQLWLDAYDSSSVIVSGSNIISVTDKSGKGVVLSNATGYTYPNNTFNGSYPSFLPNDVTTVNGAQTLGVNTSFAVSTPFTIVFVAKRLLTSNTAAAFIIDSGGSSGANREYIWDPNGTFIWQVAASTVSTAASTTSSVIITELGSSANFFANGSDALSASSITNFTTGGITVGNRFTLNNCFPGHICELIIYSTSLTNTQRQQVEGYLAWKWGLQTSLPPTHLYKNSTPNILNALGVSRPVGLPIPSIGCYPTPNTQLFTVTFTYLATGDHSQTFQVPATIFPAKLTVYMWGAGGGGTTGTSRPTNYGGAGAYIQGTLTVTPGETLGIIVGQGGIAITSNGAAAATTYGGGGGVPSGGNSTQNSSGGGRSAIQRAAADIVTAGAGGGSGMTNAGANPTSPAAYTLAGGAATWTGTASAGDYPPGYSIYAGQGGITSGNGVSGNGGASGASYLDGSVIYVGTNGSQYTGGTAGLYGGGGGGGYYGGGGGNGGDFGYGHGGGGGSSYTNLLANPTGSNSTNGYSAPNTSSPYYQSNVGAGGTTGVGGNGLIVLTYYS